VLKVEEKSALVKASLILKDRSDIGVVRLSTTTSKLTAHSKDNNFRCNMRFVEDLVKVKPRITSSVTPIALEIVDLIESTSMKPGSLSDCIENDAFITDVYNNVGTLLGITDGGNVGDGDGK